jgi:hypothetical protein
MEEQPLESSLRGMGKKKQSVAYLSKFLDLITRGWPECVQTVASRVLLTEESQKLIFGGSLILAHATRSKLFFTKK